MGIEDEIKLEDVLQEPTKTLIAKIYLQAVKTNGTVKNHEERIDKMETCIDDKIGLKAFNKIAVIVTVVLSIIMLLSSAVGILNLIFGK